jgi:PEGA domain
MPARRILAVSPDESFADQLSVALALVDATVDVHRSLETLETSSFHVALCVIHVAGELAQAADAIVPRLTGDCRVIIVLPRANLAATVALMQISDRVAGVMTAEDFDDRTLRALATRAMTGDVFGLEKALTPGTELHQYIVGEHHEKSQCLAQIGAFVAQAGVPRRYHVPIEQCLDEMLMNGLYDAPVDGHGHPLFAEITTRTRLSLRTEETVLVQYGHDGHRFGVSVRDSFGSLTRAGMLRTLHKCLHSAQQIDRKVSGAGVGLYLMLSSASTVSFHVVPGVATEVICTFAVGNAKLVLEQLGMFWELSDVSGHLSSPFPRQVAATIRSAEVRAPAFTRPRSHRRLILGGLAIAAVAVAAAVVVPQIFGDPGADGSGAAPPEVPTATVAIDSLPTGAAIEIAGKAMGSTPVSLTSLIPGTEVAILFKHPGYRDATARVKVPALGERMQLVQPLEVSEDVVRVHLVSTPPGARVLHDGAADSGADRTYTPADVFVEANKPQRFTLTMPGHAPLVIAPFTPARGTGVVEKGGTLAPE